MFKTTPRILVQFSRWKRTIPNQRIASYPLLRDIKVFHIYIFFLQIIGLVLFLLLNDVDDPMKIKL